MHRNMYQEEGLNLFENIVHVFTHRGFHAEGTELFLSFKSCLTHLNESAKNRDEGF